MSHEARFLGTAFPVASGSGIHIIEIALMPWAKRLPKCNRKCLRNTAPEAFRIDRPRFLRYIGLERKWSTWKLLLE